MAIGLRTALTAGLAALALLASAGSATAGTYDVRITDCGPDKPSPFVFIADEGMEASAACDPGVAMDVAVMSLRSVGHRAHAQAILIAPDGTSFDSFGWSGGYWRIDCRWTARVMADLRMVTGANASEKCEDLGTDDQSEWTLDRTKAISMEVECGDPAGCPVIDDPFPSLAKGGAIHMWRVQVTVRDEVAPKVATLQWRDQGRQWLRGLQTLRYDVSDSTGIREISLETSAWRDRHPVYCDFSRLVPCPAPDRELLVDTGRLPDGAHRITLEAIDAASNSSSSSIPAFVDNTAPERAHAEIDGGSAWRRDNAFTVTWGAALDRYAPIVAAHYRLCRAGTGECVRGSGTVAGIERLALRVPDAGDWALQLWREDEAGNVDERLASEPVRLRLDNAPPRLAFEPGRPDDPRRVTAVATDDLSGVAGGEIQLRAVRAKTWRSLPTRLENGRLIAEVDDDRLPAGTYELRAQARDHAGNEGASHVYADGSAALLQLPLRTQARLSAGFVRPERGKKARAEFGSKVRLEGRLTNEIGRPVRGARLYVSAQARGGRKRPAGAVTTNGSGRFRYNLRARASGTLRIRYEGSKLLGPARRELALKVPAASVLKVSRRRVLNGRNVIFRGRLRGRPFPSEPGKIIQMQAFLDEAWRAFGEPVRADRKGRWRMPYRFIGTTGLVKYRIRALVPREADYPFETGRSNVVRVTVRGQ